MVSIFIYGLDQFVVGQISKEVTPLLSKLYEMSEEDINFISPDNMLFHDGVEQTSWHALVKVEAPYEVERVEPQAAELFMKMLSEIAINVEVRFSYFEKRKRYMHINPDYPRYMSESNSIEIDSELDDIERNEGEGDEDVYMGDVFEGVDPDKFHYND